jgi:hypothetical protein
MTEGRFSRGIRQYVLRMAWGRVMCISSYGEVLLGEQVYRVEIQYLYTALVPLA